jgi:hypothetical protein
VKRVASRQPAKSAFKKTIRSVGDDCWKVNQIFKILCT